MKVIATNRKAFFEYTILDTYEAGLVLKGTEIKSIRNSKANLQDSFARPEKGELYLHGMHISPYEQGNRYNEDPRRVRKLLLHKHQILKMTAQVAEKGLTLVPLKLYLKDNRAKVEVGVVKGKKLHDKRVAIAAKDAERQKKIEEKERYR